MSLNYFQKLGQHFKTITKHKILVGQMCFKCGMYKQGILHDFSKYSFEEFWPSVRNFQGIRSPITYEKQIYGYSKCWLHHKGRNKHHWEYWIDRIDEEIIPIEMPFNYILESVIDKIAASKVYKKDDYTISYPFEFFMNSKEIHVMERETARQIRVLLAYLKDNGEQEALNYYKKLYRYWLKNKTFKI